MTINIHEKSTIKATGKCYGGNCKPVFCITTGEVFASLTDAAESIGATPSSMSWAVTGRMKTCKGKRFCLISNVTEYLDEIAETIRIREEKIAKYDAIIAEEERIKAEQERKARMAKELEDLKAQREIKMRKLTETDEAIKALEEALNA